MDNQQQREISESQSTTKLKAELTTKELDGVSGGLRDDSTAFAMMAQAQQQGVVKIFHK
jgi:hypothetical protein